MRAASLSAKRKPAKSSTECRTRNGRRNSKNKRRRRFLRRRCSVSGWIVERVTELFMRWGGQIAVAKSSPAAAMIPQLEQAGVQVLEVSPEQHARSCGRFYDLVVNDEFAHLGSGELEMAVRSAARKDMGDAWVWSRRRSTIDIAPLVAVTLAVGAITPPTDIENEIW